MKTLFLSFLILVGMAIMATQSHARMPAPYATYHAPKAGGIALDWCKKWGQKCGKPAANYFCRAKGHRKATHFEKLNNVGRTRIMKSGKICKQRGCDSFKVIKCQRKTITPVKRFHAPKLRGVALDWCFTRNRNCGSAPANTFCLSKGYTKGSVGFKKKHDVGYTRIFQTGQICGEETCDTYKFIDCQR